MISCPACKLNYEAEPEVCTRCNYPFGGTGNEKSVFIGKLVIEKSLIEETAEKIKNARIILLLIGVLNIVLTFVTETNYMLSGLMFIGFGLLTYKKPFVAVLIPYVLLVLQYLIMGILYPHTILQGLLWKMIILTGLTLALVSIIRARKLRKKSEFLKTLGKNEERFVNISEPERSVTRTTTQQ